jgi:hypothetical protein
MNNSIQYFLENVIPGLEKLKKIFLQIQCVLINI